MCWPIFTHDEAPSADAIKTVVTALTFHAWRDVRFGSKADICSATEHVRFTPNSDRRSGHQRKSRSFGSRCGADIRYDPNFHLDRIRAVFAASIFPSVSTATP